MGKLSLLVAATIPVLLLTSACSDKQVESAEPLPAASSSARSADKKAHFRNFTHTLPIARYEYSAGQERLINAAKDALTRRCMRRFGLGYALARSASADPSETPDRRYGISDPGQAAAYGYHLPPSTASVPVPSTDRSYPVLYGTVSVLSGKKVPEGGCSADAVRVWEKKRPRTEASDAARNVSVRSFEEAQSDPSVIKATKDWSICMKEKGFTYSSPLAPPGEYPLSSPTASEKERRTAMADVACKEKSHLLNIWFDAESDLQNRLIKEEQRSLKILSAEHAKVADFARSLADS
ncbi:hypothetical protein [Streptomyces sp. NPDC002619]|uniref:hypothetical protein n=1 Tax=Streptomyces sp. NPDC002619 TaxID=3364655 RepID=UPI0036B53432